MCLTSGLAGEHPRGFVIEQIRENRNLNKEQGPNLSKTVLFRPSNGLEHPRFGCGEHPSVNLRQTGLTRRTGPAWTTISL